MSLSLSSLCLSLHHLCLSSRSLYVLVHTQPALKKNYGTHVIKLDIAPVAFPLGQHLFVSASNNMFYRHSQWDKRHTICVVNLMPQDTKKEFLNRSCLGSNLQSPGWVSDTLPVCHICLVQILWNWIYLQLNIFLAFIQPVSILHSTRWLTMCVRILSNGSIIKLKAEMVATTCFGMPTNEIL